MVKSNEKTNTGEGDKGERGRTDSDESGGKSLSETSKSARGQCVGEISTGATLDHLGRDQQRGHTVTHTTHTHTLPTHSLTHPYIFTFLCVSHTNTLEVMLNFPHHIPGPSLPTIKLVDKRSLLIRSC
jgi:hypothetical protein